MSRQVDLGQIVPNIQVGTTTTGTPSTPASVVNEGTDLNPVLNFTIPKGDVGPQGPQGIQGIQGETGNGIASITKTSTSGLVDTYTITFTNGQTTTFEVTNGANGDVVDVQVDGTSVVDNGVANIILADIKQELEDMYNLLPKVSGTGETITLDGTVAGKMLIDLKGNTSQATSILPSEYTQVDYIESSGTQYIDTGVAPSTSTGIDITYIDNNQETGTDTLIGSGTSTGTGYYGITRRNAQLQLYWGNSIAITNYTFTFGERHNIKFNLNSDRKLYIDNVAKWTVSAPSSTITSNTMTLFAFKYTSIVQYADATKLYSCKIYDGANLVRNYVPCYRNSDNEVGLYDLVNNVFYTNAGTGTFTYGAVATLPNPDYPQDIHVVSGDNTIDIHKNFFDGEIEQGSFRTEDGTLIDSTTRVRSTNYINVDKDTYVFDLKNNSNYYIVVYVYDENNNYISSESNVNWSALPFTKSFSNKRKIKFGIRYANNTTITPTDVEQIIVNSPNYLRQYPINLGDIELCKIGDYQDKIDKSTGTNLVNIADISGSLSSQYYQDHETGYILEAGRTYTLSLSANVSVTPFLLSVGCGVNSYAKDVLTKSGQQNGRIYITFTPTTEQLESGNKLFIRSPRYATQQNATYTLSDIMLNEGTTALPYEPYGNVWYVNKQIGSKDFTTSDFSNMLTSYSNLDYVGFRKPTDSANKGNSNDIPVFYTKGTYTKITAFNNLENLGRVTSSGGYNLFYLGVAKGTTDVEGQAIIEGSKIYYPLATPTYTEITDSTLLSQLEALEKARSYLGQTNISQNNTDLPFIINATALREMT